MPADTLALPLTPPAGGQILHHTDRATVIWGDCRDPQVIASVPNGYGLLCTDPPYGVRYNSGRNKASTQILGDSGITDWPAILAEWVGVIGTKTRGLRDKRHALVFGYDPRDLATPLRLGGTATLIWDRCVLGTGNLGLPWGPAHERITFGVHHKGSAARAADGGRLAARLRRGSVLRVPAINTGKRRHPNEKPVSLMAQLIESSSVRGDLVVDPCAGSGSTGVAAILAGRRCFLVEHERRHAELTVQRIKAAEKIADQIAAA